MMIDRKTSTWKKQTTRPRCSRQTTPDSISVPVPVPVSLSLSLSLSPIFCVYVYLMVMSAATKHHLDAVGVRQALSALCVVVSTYTPDGISRTAAPPSAANNRFGQPRRWRHQAIIDINLRKRDSVTRSSRSGCACHCEPACRISETRRRFRWRFLGGRHRLLVGMMISVIPIVDSDRSDLIRITVATECRSSLNFIHCNKLT